jgi:hypothetical protein
MQEARGEDKPFHLRAQLRTNEGCVEVDETSEAHHLSGLLDLAAPLKLDTATHPPTRDPLLRRPRLLCARQIDTGHPSPRFPSDLGKLWLSEKFASQKDTETAARDDKVTLTWKPQLCHWDTLLGKQARNRKSMLWSTFVPEAGSYIHVWQRALVI